MENADFVREAISALGLLKPDAEPALTILMRFCDVHHPREVATKYRKAGEQLSASEKRAVGIRANAYMSCRAFSDLSELGKQRPLQAHEVTLLRASFTAFRMRKMAGFVDVPDASYSYLTWSRECPACLRLEGQKLSPESFSPFPPADCSDETCPLSLRFHIDFIGKAVERWKAANC